MALRMTANARSGEATLEHPNAYLQARPLVMDKGTRNQVDDDGNAILDDDGNPVTETYWFLNASLRWWTDDPDAGGVALRCDPEVIKLDLDLDAIDSDPITALYARLKTEPGFESAVDS